MSTTLFRGLAIDDPAADAWQREFARPRRRAKAPRGYAPPRLPEWTAPPFVTRELLGRFLLDRDTGLLHDVQAATAACGVDGIARAAWTHFADELDRSIAETAARMAAFGARLPDVTPCGHCMAPRRPRHSAH